jgi:cyanophycinase
MAAVDRELIRRLPEPARIICLPTAAGKEGPERIEYWSQLGIDHFKQLGAQVETLPVIDRKSAQDLSFSAKIAHANFVYLSGGKPDYLYQTLAGSHVWEAILHVLASGGLLAGCSAGAMIMGEKFFGFPGWKTGFNFLPGMTIIPHFDEIPAMMIQSFRWVVRRGLTLLGIEGSTALVSNGEQQYEVLGSGGVTVWNKNGKTRFTQGPLPILF